jgi:hypothetical protein
MATKNSIDSNIPIEISKGGTNTTSLANTNGVIYYDGTNLVTTTVGTATHVLTSNGAGSAPTFQAAAGGPLSINAQTDSYTLVIGDAGKLITMTKGTANTLTVPKNSAVAFPIGTQVLVYQGGEGTTTIAPVDGDVTINSADNLYDIYAQYSLVGLIKIATDTWCLFGDRK